MSKFIFVLLLLSSSSAFADKWTRADSYRELTFQTLNIIDWGQTRYIAQHPDQFYESESAWIIGKHPTEARVDIYMAESAIIHYAISRVLPRDWRAAFQYITIGDKLNVTVGNASIGIKVAF